MFTTIDQDSLAPVIAFFAPEASLTGIRPVGMGNIHDTFRADLNTNGQSRSLLVQRMNRTVFRQPFAVMENIRQVTDYLMQVPYPLQVARPLPGSNGDLLYCDNTGEYWRAFPFLDAVYTPEHLPSPGEAREAARAFGTFLSALRAFPAGVLADTIPGFHDTERRWRLFQEILAKNPAGRNHTAAPEIRFMTSARPVFAKVAQLKRSGTLPVRVTHNDTKAGNVLLDSATRKAVAVIDLDTVMPGTVLSDFGDMVRTFAPDRYEDDPDSEALQLRMDVLENLCLGFMENSSSFLSQHEVRNLPLGAEWIVAEQALRFLSDYLQGDRYYRTAYADHNLVRARNQLALWQRVKGSAAFISAIVAA